MLHIYNCMSSYYYYNYYYYYDYYSYTHTHTRVFTPVRAGICISNSSCGSVWQTSTASFFISFLFLCPHTN